MNKLRARSQTRTSSCSVEGIMGFHLTKYHDSPLVVKWLASEIKSLPVVVFYLYPKRSMNQLTGHRVAWSSAVTLQIASSCKKSEVHPGVNRQILD